MKVKCNYCEQLIDEGQKYCPNCGASMPTANRTASDQPKTIEELKAWYKAHNLPPEDVTRFFIGKDYRQPKAFGIYKAPDGDFVVYKNKADGQRAIRYKGVDEEYAVNEIYQKLKSEIADQKSRSASARASAPSRKRSKSTDGASVILLIVKILLFTRFGWAIIGMFIAFLVMIFDHTPTRGYYRYNGNDYYYQGGSWYSYDSDYDTWDFLDDDFLDDIITDDTASDYRVYDHSGTDFEDTDWYYESSSSSSSSYDYDWDSSSSWDSDSSWDSYDSWDSGSSSWDSDW